MSIWFSEHKELKANICRAEKELLENIELWLTEKTTFFYTIYNWAGFDNMSQNI